MAAGALGGDRGTLSAPEGAGDQGNACCPWWGDSSGEARPKGQRFCPCLSLLAFPWPILVPVPRQSELRPWSWQPEAPHEQTRPGGRAGRPWGRPRPDRPPSSFPTDKAIPAAPGDHQLPPRSCLLLQTSLHPRECEWYPWG